MDKEIDNSEPTRKRLRTSHACDVCRSRKIRCDGNTPCAACSVSEHECTYGSEANSRGKSDLILEGVLRVEKLLHDMNASCQTPGPITLASFTGSFSGSPLTESHPRPIDRCRPRTPVSEPQSFNNLENAVLESMHTSTTESVLQWPHFDIFPSLKADYVSIFQLEQARVPVNPNTAAYPYASASEIDEILESFEHTINFSYPTMSCSQIDKSKELIVSGIRDLDSADSCLALMMMALGCASQVVSGLARPTSLTESEIQYRMARKKMGDLYFSGALSKLYVAHTSMNATATHCLFFIAIYFAFLRRPLQAWEYINSAAAKCQLLLSYTSSEESEEQERIRRIFWSCYVLESDYLAELSALPQSGIARIESSIPLPGAYHTHYTPLEEEQSSLYFLACISMRRLLNRVHQLLYVHRSGTALDIARFPSVVAELNFQLNEWRDVLPPAFAFSLDQEVTTTEHGAFLRQRYLTCKSVIYRPYLMWVLSGLGGGKWDPELLDNCKACLDACLLHIMNLRGYSQTVLVDTWICSLSMAGAMLILLAACRIPALRGLVGQDILLAGEHLERLFRDWGLVLGEPESPSVEQSVRVIKEADKFIQQVYADDTVGFIASKKLTSAVGTLDTAPESFGSAGPGGPYEA